VEVPKSLLAVSSSSPSLVVAVLGFKKFYDSLDLSLAASTALNPPPPVTTRLLDVDKEHRMVSLELPASPCRGPSILLVHSSQGQLLETSRLQSGSPGEREECIQWLGPPASLQGSPLFLVALVLPDPRGGAGAGTGFLEVHDLWTLQALQKIPLPASSLPPQLALLLLPTEAGLEMHLLVAVGEALLALRMVPVASQVETLTALRMYERALHLVTLCQGQQARDRDRGSLLVGVDLRRLQELQAHSLWVAGDLERAVSHFLRARTPLARLLRLVPAELLAPLSALLALQRDDDDDAPLAAPALPPGQLPRAAAALVTFCEARRPQVLRRAAAAEQLRRSGTVLPEACPDPDPEEAVWDPEEALRQATLLDSVLVTALLGCRPARRAAVVALLAGEQQCGQGGSNHCHMDSLAPLLAQLGGETFEALLWLFRSQGMHERVLQALAGYRSGGVGVWSREQFFEWYAEYLQWLWHHEEDRSLPRLALGALQPVLEFSPELGLSVLLVRPAAAHKQLSFGGRGVNISEVLKLLRAVAVPASSAGPQRSVLLRKAASSSSNSIAASVLQATPLLSGHLLAVAFLECLVSVPEAPALLHDEFAELLVEGLPGPGDEAAPLGPLYRAKLQRFLANSAAYQPERLMKRLPPLPAYPQENALVLSRLGRHREVLQVHLGLLGDLAAAETYCGLIHGQGGEAARDVYLTLLQVVLAGPSAEELVMALAEKYHRRLPDPFAPLAMLPSHTPLRTVARYCATVLEFAAARKRSLQVLHQLLRVREVDLRVDRS